MWPQTASRGRFSSIARSSAGLPKWVSSPALSQCPSGGECRTSTAPSGQGASMPAASSSSRSKLHCQGVTGMPAPRPKNSIPAIVIPSPCRTRADSQPRAASRSASTVSLLPGTSTVGVAIAASTPIVSSSPSCTEAKSPAPITTSASADISTSRAPCSRSRWRSLKASSFTPGNLSAVLLGPRLQVEVEQRLGDDHVRDQQRVDQRPEQVDQEEGERGEDQPQGQDRAGDEEQGDQEDLDPDGVPPAPADQVGAAAQRLARRLVGEQDLLPGERPADRLPDREGNADHGYGHEEDSQHRQQESAEDPPEPLPHPVPAGAEAGRAGFRQEPHEDDHDRRDDRQRDRPREGFDQVGQCQVDARAPGRTVGGAATGEQPPEQVGGADDHQPGQGDRQQDGPVTAVDLPRGADQLAEGAPGPQPLEVDRPPAGEADEERDQQAQEDQGADRQNP